MLLKNIPSSQARLDRINRADILALRTVVRPTSEEEEEEEEHLSVERNWGWSIAFCCWLEGCLGPLAVSMDLFSMKGSIKPGAKTAKLRWRRFRKDSQSVSAGERERERTRGQAGGNFCIFLGETERCSGQRKSQSQGWSLGLPNKLVRRKVSCFVQGDNWFARGRRQSLGGLPRQSATSNLSESRLLRCRCHASCPMTRRRRRQKRRRKKKTAFVKSHTWVVDGNRRSFLNWTPLGMKRRWGDMGGGEEGWLIIPFYLQWLIIQLCRRRYADFVTRQHNVT